MRITYNVAIRMVCLAALLTGLYGCNRTATPFAQPPPKPIVTIAWPEADQLFRQDPLWLGGDDAYSIDLEDGRILWLFGDSFIATTARHRRSEAVIIRNSVGLQSGRDPSCAAMAFFWRKRGGLPRSFFPEHNGTWFWPGNGLKVGEKLLIFLTAIGRAPNELGFRVTGWSAVVIDSTVGSPPDWPLRPPVPRANHHGIILGAGSVFFRDAYLYAFGYHPGNRSVYLVRWAAEAIVTRDFCRPQWWTDPPGRWVTKFSNGTAPFPLFSKGQNEFSVHYDSSLNRFVEIQTIGFGPAWIGLRTAPNLTGPWGPLRPFYHPNERDLDRVLIYAAKAHPHLSDDDVILTYVTNSLNLKTAMENDNLYYPRFLKVKF